MKTLIKLFAIVLLFTQVYGITSQAQQPNYFAQHGKALVRKEIAKPVQSTPLKSSTTSTTQQPVKSTVQLKQQSFMRAADGGDLDL